MNVIDFFNETYKHKPKPYRYNEFLAKKNHIDKDQVLEAKRETADQQTSFIDKNGKLKYNLRKINELPEFIARLKPNMSYPLVCEHVFFNFEFLMGYLTHKSANEIMDYINHFPLHSTYKLTEETEKIAIQIHFFRLILHQVIFNVTNCPSSAGAKILESLMVFQKHFNYIESFLEQYDQQSYRTCSLMLPYQIASTPASDILIKYDKHNQPIYKCVFDGDDDKLFMVLADRLALFSLKDLKDYGATLIESSSDPILFLALYLDESEEKESGKGNVELKDYEGGFMIANKHTLWSYSFQGLKVLKKKKLQLQTTSLSPKKKSISF